MPATTARFVCPDPACGKTSTGTDGLVGKTVRCKHCGQQFVARPTVAEGASETRGPDRPPAPAGGEAPGTIGRFVVRGRVGAGAFGTVYRAYDPHLDREVALKVPNAGVLDSPKRVERFIREAKAAANLRHPHIVPVYEAGRDGDRYYIASAFIPGEPLAETIEERGTDFRRAARLVRELADALQCAHGQGVVHRDVKPANVMTDAGDHAHLMDFGLAARAAEAEKLTSDGAILGTPSYMAPEVAGGHVGEAKPAADQYALGVVLYELLTGRTPFEGPPASVLYQVMNSTPETPRKVRPYTPRDLETVCLKAMAKRPEDRYPDCGALADDLRRFLDGEPVRARKAGLGERAVRWARREPRLALSLGAAVAGLAVAAAVGGLSAAALSASAEELKQANQEAVAAADSAREQERRATAQAEVARQAEHDRDAEAKAARAAQGEAEAAKRRAETEAENARKARADAEKKAADLQVALTDLRQATEHRAAAEQAVKDKDTDRLLREANDRVQSGGHARAAELLDKIPAESRRWEWAVLREFARAEGAPFAEVPLPVGRETRYFLRFSGDLSKTVVVDNPRPNETQFVVMDADRKAELYRAKVPIATGADEVQRTVVSQDGSYLAHVTWEYEFGVPVQSRVHLWDVNGRRPVREPFRLADGHIVVAASAHPTAGQFAVAGFYTRTVRQGDKTIPTAAVWFSVLDAATGQVIDGRDLTLPFRDLTGFGFLPGGSELYFGLRKDVYTVAVRTREEVRRGEKKQPDMTREDLRALPGDAAGILPVPPDRLFAHQGRVKVWNVPTHAVARELADSEAVFWPTLAVTPDGKRAAAFVLSAKEDVGLAAWDLATGKRTLALPGLATFNQTVNPYAHNLPKPRVTTGLLDFAVSPDGDRIVYRHDHALRVIRVPAPTK